MGKRAVRTSRRAIDPMFFIPDGVDELVYEELERSLTGQEDEFGDNVEIDDIIIIDDDNDDDVSDLPDTPTIVGIVSQTIRTAATGNQVVDVVIEVEDIDGLEYEIRWVPV